MLAERMGEVGELTCRVENAWPCRKALVGTWSAICVCVIVTVHGCIYKTTDSNLLTSDHCSPNCSLLF